jgi:hypothetical protein
MFYVEIEEIVVKLGFQLIPNCVINHKFYTSKAPNPSAVLLLKFRA